ncbi:MAG: RNA-binding protein [Conexivisphaera sp.]|jgi:DNA-binding protein
MEESALIIVSTKKPVMNYVTACVTAFNSGHRKLLLRARGRSISSAVDVVNLLKSGFLSGLKVERVGVGSEDVDGGTDPVSFIEIEISRP